VLKKVLIATDGSNHANKAVEFGSEIAAKFGAEVVLTHVLLRGEISENLRHMAEVEYAVAEGGKALSDAIATIPEGRFPASIDFRKKNATSESEILRAVGEQILSEAERRARQHGVSSIEKRIEDGDPVKRILEIADDTKADIIVTGSRGLSDFKSLMLGGVSHKLSHLSRITCITVR